MTAPDDIEFFQLCSMRGRLRLEVKGFRFRLPTLKYVNKKLGTNYTRKTQALEALDKIIEERLDVRGLDRQD